MPIRPEHRPAFERLRKEHHIHFVGPISSERWPENHRNVFESIEKLKQFRYATYATTQEIGGGFDWKGKAKEHARRLSEKADDCVSRNEATWRFACEPLVFSRLTSEIACKTCRKRIWRSEIEATLDDENRNAAKLKKRQENRDPCRCPRSTRPDDEDERVGLNRLFIDRAEDKVVHPRDLAQQLPQEQRPDRVYGLRQTRNFEDLMFKQLGNNELLGDRLPEQPHSDVQGKALLFPFLVIEAKAGNAPDDWSSIHLQTAFPIYTYLNTQESLRSAASQRSKWAAGPLVWFFMSRGDDWRLSLAYRKPGSGQPSSAQPHHTTEIAQVWNGCITNRDDALQLFLIVDYMSDWARDVYRPALLTELRILASDEHDLATVYTDTDIYSSWGVLPSVEAAQPGHHALQAAFRSLDSPLGIIRHIAPIESRFLNLFISADNIQTFLLSMPTRPRQYFIRRVLDEFHSTQTPCLLTSDQMNGMEEVWTGQLRPRTPFNLKETKFYTVHLVSYFISANWDQIRELCVISIAEDAFETFITESKLKTRRGSKAQKPFPVIDGDEFQPCDVLTDCVARLHGASADHNLLACISRSSGYIDTSHDATWLQFKAYDAGIWQLVNFAYKFYKKGELEPDLPFLRLSRLYETQDISHDVSSTTESNVLNNTGCRSDAMAVNEQTMSYSRIKAMCDLEIKLDGGVEFTGSCSDHSHPIPPLCGNLQVSDAGTILVNGELKHAIEGESPSKICIYIARGALEPPCTGVLARTIKETFEDHDVYHTTRYNGRVAVRNDFSACVWNLREPYGVFFSYGSRFSFVKWLEGLNQPLPTRQGSRRGPRDTGRCIFEREYHPWGGEHQIEVSPYNRLVTRHIFIELLVTAEVIAWASVAIEKARRGIVCCALCARENVGLLTNTDSDADEEYNYVGGLCRDCKDDLDPQSSCRLDSQFKKSLPNILEKVRSGALTDPPNGYRIATPLSSHYYDIVENERGTVETSDNSNQDQPRAENIIFQHTSSRVDIDDNFANEQRRGQLVRLLTEAGAVAKKRKRD